MTIQDSLRQLANELNSFSNGDENAEDSKVIKIISEIEGKLVGCCVVKSKKRFGIWKEIFEFGSKLDNNSVESARNLFERIKSLLERLNMFFEVSNDAATTSVPQKNDAAILFCSLGNVNDQFDLIENLMMQKMR